MPINQCEDVQIVHFDIKSHKCCPFQYLRTIIIVVDWVYRISSYNTFLDQVIFSTNPYYEFEFYVNLVVQCFRDISDLFMNVIITVNFMYQ